MFENLETHVSRGPCESLCSYGNGDYKSFSCAFSKERLVAHLRTNVFDRGAIRADNFFSSLTDASNMHKIKNSIWGDKTNAPAGVVHGFE